MTKREASANTVLNQYLREKNLYCYYELKVAVKDKFYFSKIEVGQKSGLPALEQNGLVWKLSDMDMRVKPCDGFSAPPLPTYLVIKFGKTFYFVRYYLIKEMMDAKEKGIWESQAADLAEYVFHN